MPELPEVETVRRTLKNFVLHQKVMDIECLYDPIVENSIQSLIGQSIVDIDRYGKYLIFIFEKDALLSHLRMEGKFLYEPTSTPIEKHVHVIFHLEHGMDLRYHDTRKFGRMRLVSKSNYRIEEPLCLLGREPFDLDERSFYALLHQSHMPMKVFLLDQHKMCGLGNIYANEVLFRSSIHPMKMSDTLTKVQAKTILNQCVETLNEAIAMGGTTIRSFSSNGIHGLFSQDLCVHGKDQTPCPVCGTLIKKEMYKGRSIYYCPTCQKKPRRRNKT